MSSVSLKGNASGSGTVTVEAPSTNSNRSLTLPDRDGELLNISGGLGTEGQIPMVNTGATALEWKTTGLDLITSTVISNDAALYFDLPVNTYDRFVFSVDNVVPATNNVEFWANLSVDGGVTVRSTTGDYYISGWNSTGGSHGGTSAALVAIYGGGSIGLGNAAGEHGVSGTVYVHRPGDSSVKTSGMFLFAGWTDTAGVYSSGLVGGASTTAVADDCVVFRMSSGNLASGSITAYGVRNS